MRLSFSTNAFTRQSVFEAVRKIAATGYDAVELLADAPHLYADSVAPYQLRELKALLSELGLPVANLNANTAVGYYGRDFWEPLFEPSLANPDPPERRWRIDYTKKCIEMAQVLGSPNVSVTSGRMVPGAEPSRSMDLLRESLREIADYGSERGVRIGIEYEPGLLVESFEELGALLDAVGSPYLGANLDLGHSHVLGESPETVIRGLGSRLFHVHLEDIRSRKHYHLVPGTGDMDFGRLFGALNDAGYDGAVTVELYTYPHDPEEAAKKSLIYLRDFISPYHLPADKEE